MRTSKIARSWLAASAVALLVSCGGSGDGGKDGTGSRGLTDPVPNGSSSQGAVAVRLQISPRADTATGTHTEGDTLHLTVVALDSSGKSVAMTSPVMWTAIGSAVTINAAGTVTMVSSGIGRIAASLGKLADTVSFNLTVMPKLALRISPRADTTRNHTVGDTLHFSASVTDVFLGKDVSSVTPVVWTSLDTTATVGVSGNVVVRRSGIARIVAAAANVADTAAFTFRVTLPTLRLVSINGVTLNAVGPNAVADSFNVSIEVRNPPDGYVLSTVIFAANTPTGRSSTTTPSALSIQPGETRTVVVRNRYTPKGNYTARPEGYAGPFSVSGQSVLLAVTNSDVIPPQLLSLAPAHDTTWKAGTPLKITLNVVDLESGVHGFNVKTTWAGPQNPGCIGNPSGGVDPNVTFNGIPVTLDFSGCVVPLGANIIVITGMDRAGNTTTKTLTITGI